MLILGAFAVAYYLRDLILVIITAVVLASALEPATNRLGRMGVPRVLAVVLLYLGIIGALSAVFYFFLPPLIRDANAFITALPTYLEALKVSEGGSLISATGSNIGEQIVQMRSVISSSSSSVLSAATAVFGGLLSFVLIFVLSFYFAVQERGIDDFLRIITPLPRHEYILDLWKRAQRKIGLWLQGQLLLSVIVGVLVYAGFFVVGKLTGIEMRYALLLSILAAVLELIPVFGSILAAVPAVVVSFIDGGTSLALIVILMYVVVNQLEGNVIYPLVVQKVVGVPPLVVILAIIAGFQLGGFLGVVIAVPIAAALQEYISDTQKSKRKRHEPQPEPLPSAVV